VGLGVHRVLRPPALPIAARLLLGLFRFLLLPFFLSPRLLLIFLCLLLHFFFSFSWRFAWREGSS
jgi:hypothetical protein